MTLPANITPATTDEKVTITIEFAVPHPTAAGPKAADIILACSPQIIALAQTIKTKSGNTPVSMSYESVPAVYVI